MTITFVGGDGAASGSSQPSLSLPGGIAEDDIVIAASTYDPDPPENLNMDAMVSSGYTLIEDLYANDTYDCNMGSHYKVQGATPDSTVQWDDVTAGEDGVTHLYMVFRGIDAATPLDATPTTATGTNSYNPNPPVITTNTDNAAVVALGAVTEPASPPTAPSGYGDLTYGSNSDYFELVAGSWLVKSSAGAENPGSYTGISGGTYDSWCAVTVAIRPASTSGHDLLANDLESSSEVTGPSIGQVHGIAANDVESTSEFSSPSLGQVHALTADDVESSSEVAAPALGESHVLTANDTESSSEVSSPAIGQVHGITADDTESSSELTSPSLGQVHVLAANDVESSSEVSGPAIGQVHALAADDIQSASNVTAPAVGQIHALTANDVESASEVSAPALDAMEIAGILGYGGMVLNVGRLMTR